jgi:FkbM family methyltransferase
MSLARSLIERSTRSWAYRRRLPAEFGSAPIVVSPSAGLKYLFKPMSQIDPSLLRNVNELVRPSDVVWDIGANVGLFTFSAAVRAQASGHVVAFEPDLWLVSLLRRSQTLQPASSAPMTIVPVAVASHVALRKFQIAARSRAMNSLSGYGLSQTGGTLEEQTVPAFDLDWLLASLPPPPHPEMRCRRSRIRDIPTTREDADGNPSGGHMRGRRFHYRRYDTNIPRKRLLSL